MSVDIPESAQIVRRWKTEEKENGLELTDTKEGVKIWVNSFLRDVDSIRMCCIESYEPVILRNPKVIDVATHIFSALTGLVGLAFRKLR